MHARTTATALVAFSLLLMTAAPARAVVVFEVPIDMMFSDISLSGSGPMPLGTDWDSVESGVTVTSSNVASSTMAGVVSVSDLFDITVDLTGTFYLDLSFTDIDAANDYGAGLGATVSLPASVDKPLVIGLNFTVTLAQLIGIAEHQLANPGATIQEAAEAYNATVLPGGEIAFTLSDPGVETALGVDLNSNGSDDALTYFGSSLMFSSLGDLDLLTESLTTGATISASSVSFTGTVDDLLADPPFTISLDGSFTLATSVPAPASVLLLALGIAGMSARRVLRRAA